MVLVKQNVRLLLLGVSSYKVSFWQLLVTSVAYLMFDLIEKIYNVHRSQQRWWLRVILEICDDKDYDD